VPSSEHVANHLVVQAARRLEIVCIVAFGSILVTWLATIIISGTLTREFRELHQWVPPVTALGASAAVLALVRSRRFSPSRLVRLGLVYQVVVSYTITCAAHLGGFQGLTPADFDVDRIGLTYVAPWMLFFTVLVPAPPREALVALIASASAAPLVHLAQVSVGMAPALGLQQFLPVFVFPYAVTTVVAYLAARVVHQLGVEVRRAHELGSYHLEKLLGRGGMGEVWRASHRRLARPAAIKLIRPEALATDAALAEVAVARFEREAQIIASLQSPHTIALYDFGTTEDGTLFYVMELLDGIDLEALVRRFGPLPAERTVHLLRQVCASLAEAHRHGVVHRDIKPANIYLCRRGIEHDVVKVLDFGLAKHTVPSEEAEATISTRANAIPGTPHYMAPELVQGQCTVDGRSDLYALGCVAFWLLTGRVVFEAATITAAIIAHVQREPVPPSAVSELPVPGALDRIVLDCLAKDPASRPQTSEELAARLDTVQCGRRWLEAEAARWWELHFPTEAPPTGQGLRRRTAPGSVREDD
jgi:serine/threonine-protein kinase